MKIKSSRDFITERIDDLALEYHNKFYCDLPDKLQETIWMMAHKEYSNYLAGFIDAAYDRRRERL